MYGLTEYGNTMNILMLTQAKDSLTIQTELENIKVRFC